MSRTLINFLLDSLLLATFSLLIWASVVVRFVFPPGTSANGWRLWGMDYHQWATLQFSLVSILTLGVLVHVMLHWSWVCGVLAVRLGKGKKAKVDDGAQTLYGVGLLILLLNVLGLAIAAAAICIQKPH